MKLKTNLKLREVADRYMLVDVSDSDANITDVYTLNSTAAFVWRAAASAPCVPSPQQLADMLCADYDVDPEVALADVSRLLLVWRESGLIVPD